MQEAFGLPDYMVPRCLLPVGYADPSAGPYRPWHDVYKSLHEMAEVL